MGITAIGKNLQLGDLPLNMAVSPDKKWIAVTNNGQGTQSLQLLDVAHEVILDSKDLSVSWYGLAWGSNSHTLWVSGGNGNYILKFEIKDQKLAVIDTVFLGRPWPEKISITGVSIDDVSHRIYVLTKENNSLYIIDELQKRLVKIVPLGGEGYASVLSLDRKTLYISCWGCDKAIFFDTESMQIKASVNVGDNPNELIINKAGTLLYVANANDNSVSVIDLKQL